MKSVGDSYLEDKIEALWKKRFQKKSFTTGKVRGYYKRSLERHPIVGTYKLDYEKLIMNTQDNTGVTRWFGKVHSDSLSINLSKIYQNKAMTVSIESVFNRKSNELEGAWKSRRVLNSELKLIFVEDKPLSKQ